MQQLLSEQDHERHRAIALNQSARKEMLMQDLKVLGLAAIAAMAFTALLGVGTAEASSLKVFGAAGSLPTGTVVEASLEAGNSILLEDVFGAVGATCTGSNMAGTLSQVTPTGQPTGSLSALSFTSCVNTVDVESKGALEIRNIAGTTNGTVFSENAKIKVLILNQSCIANTGSGTAIGTLTSATSASTKATIDLNVLLPWEGCSITSARWTAKYEVSRPLGLVSEP